MTIPPLRRWLKNTAVFAFTLLIAVTAVDFLRRPAPPPNAAQTRLTDLDGNTFFPAQLAQEKPAILYFWATWCSYCHYTSPAVNRLVQESTPVVSIALKSGTPEQVRYFLAEHHLNIPTVNDPNGDLANQWGIQVTPTVLILHQGKLHHTAGWTSYWGLKVRLIFAEFWG